MKIDVRKLTLVKVGDELAFPKRFPVEETVGDLDVTLQVEVDRWGRTTCTRLTADGPVTGEALRDIPVATLLRRAMELLARLGPAGRIDHLAGGITQLSPLDPGGVERVAQGARKPRRGSPITDENLQAVAEVYTEALESTVTGRSAPTAAVEASMGVSRSTAARWVGLARERGFLGPAQHGKASA